MADNIAITAGSGTTIATDDVSGVHYQIIKLAYGALDSATVVSTSNPLPVVLQNLEKAEDAAHSSGDKGLMALAVRESTLTDLSAGNTDGDYEPLQVNGSGALYVHSVPHTSGGLSTNDNIDVDESEDNVKTSAGQLYGMIITNLTASKRYFKLYNDVAANIAVGTDTPKMTIPLQANSTYFFEFPTGISLANGWCIAATTGVAANDTGAPGANDVTCTSFYK